MAINAPGSGSQTWANLENMRLLGRVAHEPLALLKSMKRGALLLLRSAHPTLAGTEARPTNLKLETRNFS